MVSCLELESGVLYNKHPFLLFEGAEGVVGVQLEEDRPLAEEEVDELLEEFQEEEFTDLEPEEGSQLLQCVIKHHPQQYSQVYGGLWSDVWNSLKTGRSPEQQKEYEELQEYLKKNKSRMEILDKAFKSSEKIQKFIDKYADVITNKPEKMAELATLLKLGPDYIKALEDDMLKNKGTKYSVPIKDFPGIDKTEWDLDETELRSRLMESLQRKGFLKDEDYDSINVKTMGLTPKDRVVIIDSDVMGLARFNRLFPFIKPKPVT